MPSEIFDAAVIGSGPGGLVSALYLKRFNRSVILISKGEPRATWIPRIRNLIGYSRRTSGSQLLKRMMRQLAPHKVPVLYGRASVKRDKNIFEIKVGHQILKARKVVLATGMKDEQPDGISNLKELTLAGVIGYCPVCDGFEHTNKKIALMARDVKGLRKIRILLNFTPYLEIIYIGKKPIPSYWKSEIKKHKLKVLKGDLHSLQLSKSGLVIRVGKKKVKVDYLYIALGAKVPNEAFRYIRSLKRNRAGYIETNSHQETSVKGLYAVGDCVNSLSQVSVAVGQAAIAATHIHNQVLD